MSQITEDNSPDSFEDDFDDVDTNPIEKTDAFDLLLRAVDSINISSVWRVTSESLGNNCNYIISHKNFAFQFKLKNLSHAQLFCSLLNVVADEGSNFSIELKRGLGFGTS